MKITTLLPLRVLLAQRAQRAFIARGLASGEKARQTGRYVPADAVMKKLSRRLATARRAS